MTTHPQSSRQPVQSSQMDDYLFDLKGYLILEQAVSPAEVSALNECLDSIPPLEKGQWHGHVHCQDTDQPEKFGINLQQIYEAGPPFESLIDHPSWIERVKRYVGGEGTFDHQHGTVCIDENFANFRGPGQAISLHSGGHDRAKRVQFRYHDGKFFCGQINVLIALTDIGPGDGGTMIIPASHKSNIEHPHFRTQVYGEVAVDDVVAAEEVYMKAGDALLFVDALAHGSAERLNPGQRRIVVYRYSPTYVNSRYGYRPSPALLERLTDEQRAIVNPYNQPLVPPV